MIGLIKRYRQRQASRVRSEQALFSYRVHVGAYLRWFASEPDVCALLENLKAIADGGMSAQPLGNAELRDKVRALRAAEYQSTRTNEMAHALAHLRNLVREIDGVGETWADERRRCTLSGGAVTLGELRAAKAFLTRLDSQRIATHEAARKTTGAQA